MIALVKQKYSKHSPNKYRLININIENILGISVELLTTVTQNCFGIQIIFYGDEDESYPDDHAGHLVVEFEQWTVENDAILLEILNNLLQNRQLILDIWSHF